MFHINGNFRTVQDPQAFMNAFWEFLQKNGTKFYGDISCADGKHYAEMSDPKVLPRDNPAFEESYGKSPLWNERALEIEAKCFQNIKDDDWDLTVTLEDADGK